MASQNSGSGLASIQVFSGIGIGLLIGIIVGLSSSEVVSIILGALAALLAAFLGLQDQRASAEEEGPAINTLKMSGLRAGSFGVSCVIAILLGMYLRTHQVLSDTISLKEQVDVWVEAGYDTTQARQYVVFQKLGITPENTQVEARESNAVQQKALLGVLFSGEGERNYCNDLSMQTHGNSAEAVLQAYRATENEPFVALADNIEQHIPSNARPYFLTEVENILCGVRESINAIDLSAEEQYRADLKISLKEAIGSL